MKADDVKVSCYKCIKFLLMENYSSTFYNYCVLLSNKKTTPDGVAFSIYYCTT